MTPAQENAIRMGVRCGGTSFLVFAVAALFGATYVVTDYWRQNTFFVLAASVVGAVFGHRRGL